MKKFFQDDRMFVVLADSEELVSELETLLMSENWAGAFVSGLGACDQVEIGFYDFSARDYVFRSINENLEVVSLTGNLSWQNGHPRAHLHGLLGQSSLNALAGHIKSLRVRGTLEMVITVWSGDKLERAFDDQTGLHLF